MTDSIYREQILDHNKNPRNKGALESPEFTYEDVNPLCGDEIRMDVQTDGERVTEIRFSGRGCAISQAAASMLTEMVEGETLDAVKAISRDDLLEELGVQISPARMKCAMLGLKVLKAGIYGVPPADDQL